MGKGRTGRCRRQPSDVDIVLDRESEAIERLVLLASRFDLLGLSEQIFRRAKGDKDRGIVGVGKALKRTTDRRGRANGHRKLGSLHRHLTIWSKRRLG